MLLLSSGIGLVVCHAPSSLGVLLRRQDAIAALVGVLAIVLESDCAGRERLFWR